MELKQLFLEQLEREAASSRKVIERVPEGQNGWKPHERSMELGYLAVLVATMPGWVALMIDRDELNLGDPANELMRVKAVETRAELFSLLDEALTKSRKSLEGTTEEHLLKPWRFCINEKVAGEGPRYMMIAESALTHMAHHRGQLTVYLRLNGAKVPAVYGPSADERF